MSHNLIFVSGVHGVGKTTYCKELSKFLQIPHFAASDIIRSEKSSELEQNSKRVKDANKNQDILIQGLNSLDLLGKEILLDGHFVLLQNNIIKRLPLSTYEDLGINKIILLVDNPKNILSRISKRDQNNEFSLELISEMQIQEEKYANEVAKLLSIELEIKKIIE